MNFLNLYSAGILALAGLILAGWLLLRHRVTKARILILTILVLAVSGVGWMVRPQQTALEEPASLDGRIGAGQPVLLELQSPF
jgi:hypothetical protein